MASGGHSSSRCAGLSLSRPLLLQSTGSRRAGSVVVVHGPSCSAACGIFPDQGSNPCPLHWQADSQPLHHQGSPWIVILNFWLQPSTALLGCLVYSCFGSCFHLTFLLVGFFFFTFAYFRIILAYIFSVSIIVSVVSSKSPWSFLLENHIQSIHVGAKYAPLTIHGNTCMYPSLCIYT